MGFLFVLGPNFRMSRSLFSGDPPVRADPLRVPWLAPFYFVRFLCRGYPFRLDSPCRVHFAALYRSYPTTNFTDLFPFFSPPLPPCCCRDRPLILLAFLLLDRPILLNLDNPSLLWLDPWFLNVIFLRAHPGAEPSWFCLH